MPRDDFFKKKLAALLHDSPCKPWIISGELSWLGKHEEDAKSLANQLFGEEISRLIDHDDVKQSDSLAASFDRWALSSLMGGDYERGAFLTKDVRLFNPFYRQKPYEARLQPPPKEQLQYHEQLSKFVKDIRFIHQGALSDGGWCLAYNTFFATYEYLWCKYFGTPGPADTRFPTHTIFDHTYATASTLNMVGDGTIDGYMVSIDLGGVQKFISESRKLRDLWASSWLTSALAWSIILPFIENFGPDIMVLPTARGNPFFYHTLAVMLNHHGLNIRRDIPSFEKAAELAGYEIGLGYPRHAVVPATITLILPSTKSHSEDAKLTVDGKELEPSDTKEIAAFVDEIYLSKWRRLIARTLDIITASWPKLGWLKQVFSDMGLNDSPILPLRVAVAEIKSPPSSKENYLAYHNAFRKVSTALREAGGLKVSPSATLHLTEYTKNYERYPPASREHRFYACSVCGEVPAVPNSFDVAEEINTNEKNLITIEEDRRAVERLCPYCLMKRLLTTKSVFPQILDVLLGRYSEPYFTRLPSVSSVAAINFKQAVVSAAMRNREVLKHLEHVIDDVEDINQLVSYQVAYGPEQQLLHQVLNNFKGTEAAILGTLAIGDAEELLLVGKRRSMVGRLVQATREALPSETTVLNIYYAMIKGDGDDVGKVVNGDIGDVSAIPSFDNLFHYLSTLTPNLEIGKLFKMLGDGKLEEAAQLLSSILSRETRDTLERTREMLALLKDGLKIESEDGDEWKKRLPVSPAYHAALSRSLMTLATRTSREISDRGGFVVYSGGDDILAVSPVEAALDVASEMRILYGGKPKMGFLEPNGRVLTPSLGDLGQSFSITYAHYRYPLSHVLNNVVDALEDEAKEVEWLESNKTLLRKDSAVITYLLRGGGPIQSRLPFSDVLKRIDKDLISASLLRDLAEWKGRIQTANSASATSLAKEMIKYIVDRNPTDGDLPSKGKARELLGKGLSYRWCYHHESPDEKRQSANGKLLLDELLAALMAELGARRGVES